MEKESSQQCTTKKEFKREFCTKAFNTKQKCKKHVIRIHDTHQKKHKCDACDRSFLEKHHLTRHKAIVHEKIRIKCDQCEKLFSTNSLRQKHMLRIHQNVKDVCNFCYNKIHLGHLPRHIKKYHSEGANYQCEQCKIVFRTEALLQLHKDKHHSEHSCTRCGKRINNPGYLKKHMQICQKSNDSKQNDLKTAVHKCQLCPRAFSNGCNLNRHRKNYHPTGESYQCKTCEKKF